MSGKPKTALQDGYEADDEALDITYFPRCEFYSRFKDTTQFRMNDYHFWGTYIRSTARGGGYDRVTAELQRQKKSKIAINTKLTHDYKQNKPQSTGHAHTGNIEHPFRYKPYSMLLGSGDKKQISIVNSKLYDDLLKYKNQMCSNTVEEFLRLKGPSSVVDVYHRNEYPCLLVHVRQIEGKYFYKAIMAYYVGIVNNYAKKSGLPIEIVIRSSFGHFTPSVSDTGDNSFRINIGLIPKQYISCLVFGLQELDKVVKAWQGHILADTVLEKQNREAKYYNKVKSAKVILWSKTQTIIEILKSVGDAGGKKDVVSQLLRLRHYSDLLADYVMEECAKEGDLNYAEPMGEMLSKVAYTEHEVLEESDEESDHESARVHMRQVDFAHFQSSNIALSSITKHSLKQDQKFWEIISKTFLALQVEDAEIRTMQNNVEIGSLFKKLEQAHIQFLKNSMVGEAIDGAGSDSEREILTEDLRLYSRKLIVPSGMKAVMFASYVALYTAMQQKQYIDMASVLVNTKHMYYETGDAITYVRNAFLPLLGRGVASLKSHSSSVNGIHCLDINHCFSDPKQLDKDICTLLDAVPQDNKFPIILDYTSATSIRVRNAILKAFQRQNTEIVLLVNSGLKNEQGGIDLNPYGTLRIFTRDPRKLIELYDLVRGCMTIDNVPKVSHQIRRLYKSVGFTLTIDEMFNSHSITCRPASLRSGYGRFVISFDDVDRSVFDFCEFISYDNENKFLLSLGYTMSEIKKLFHYERDKWSILTSDEARSLYLIGAVMDKMSIESLYNRHFRAIELYGDKRILNYAGDDYLSKERVIEFIKSDFGFQEIASFDATMVLGEFELWDIIKNWDCIKILFFNDNKDALLEVYWNNLCSFDDLSYLYEKDGFCELIEFGDEELLKRIDEQVLKYQKFAALGYSRDLIISRMQYPNDSDEDDDQYYAGNMLEGISGCFPMFRKSVEANADLFNVHIIDFIPQQIKGLKRLIIDSDNSKTNSYIKREDLDVIYTNTQGNTASCVDNALYTVLQARNLGLNAFLYKMKHHMVALIYYPSDKYKSISDVITKIHASAVVSSIPWESYKEAMVGTLSGVKNNIESVLVLRNGNRNTYNEKVEDRLKLCMLSWLDSYLIYLKYRSNIKKLELVLEKYNLAISWQKALTSQKDFRIIARALHPDKNGDSDDFKFYNNFREEYNNPDIAVLRSEAYNYVLNKCYKVSITFKVLDTGIDVIRSYYNPTVYNLVNTAIGGLHLFGTITGISKSLIVASILSAGYITYDQGIIAGVQSLGISMLYMAIPTMLVATNPYIASIYIGGTLLYSGYNLVNNSSSLYNEVIAADTSLKSLEVYNDIYQDAGEVIVTRDDIIA